MARPRCSASNKEKFPNKLECQLAIANIGKTQAKHRKQKYRETPTGSYKCPSCGAHHMTSS
jgi:hypothetical protein